MKKITGQMKLQIPAGKANPAPPVGPALGQHGVNIMEFCKQFNAADPGPGEGEPDHPGHHHRLRRPVLQLHPQDAARRRPAQEGGRAPHREEEGLGRAQARQGEGGAGDAQAGGADRQDEDAGHDRRDASQAAMRTVEGTALFDGHRGGRLGRRETRTWRTSGRSTRRRRRKVDRNKRYKLDDALQLVKEHRHQEVRRVGRRGHQPGRRPQARRSGGPRRGGAAARDGQGGAAGRLRQGRQGARGAGGRRRHRRCRGPGREDPGRLHGLRQGARHPRHDGRGGPPREGARAARPDAEPEGGHRHHGHRPRGEGAEGRQGGVPGREGRDRPRAVRQGLLRPRTS